MRFKNNEIKVILQGNPSLCNGLVSLIAMWKALKNDGEGVVVEYGGLQTEEWARVTIVCLESEAVVSEYDEIFG